MRTRLPRAERERQMLETAHALFAERGMDSLALKKYEQATADAAVSRATVQAYYGLARAHEQRGSAQRAIEMYEKILTFYRRMTNSFSGYSPFELEQLLPPGKRLSDARTDDSVLTAMLHNAEARTTIQPRVGPPLQFWSIFSAAMNENPPPQSQIDAVLPQFKYLGIELGAMETREREPASSRRNETRSRGSWRNDEP